MSKTRLFLIQKKMIYTNKDVRKFPMRPFSVLKIKFSDFNVAKNFTRYHDVCDAVNSCLQEQRQAENY